MSVVQIVPATPAHAQHIARNLREADKAELMTTAPAKLIGILMEAITVSRWAHVALVDGEPVLAYGVSPHEANPNWGVPWLLGTDGMRRIRKQFIQTCRGEVELMETRFTFLFNRVHDRNALAIKWLMWLGFTIDFARPVQVRGRTFLNFYRGNPHV
jgi:hypothetical protein